MRGLALIFAAAMVAGGVATADAQVPEIVNSTPGVMMSGSASVKSTALPDKAKEFISKNFKYQRVMHCEQMTPSGRYEVRLGDGTEIDFNADGTWVEVSARDDRALSQALLAKLLPKKAYDEIVRDGYGHTIESVERSAGGHYIVEVDEVLYDEIEFDVNGTPLAFYYD